MDTTKRYKGQPMQNELKESKNRKEKLDFEMLLMHEVFNLGSKGISIKIHDTSEDFKAVFSDNPDQVFGAIFDDASDIIQLHLMWFLFDDEYLAKGNRKIPKGDSQVSLRHVLTHEFCHYALGDGLTVNGSHGIEFQTLLFDKFNEVNELARQKKLKR